MNILSLIGPSLPLFEEDLLSSVIGFKEAVSGGRFL